MYTNKETNPSVDINSKNKHLPITGSYNTNIFKHKHLIPLQNLYQLPIIKMGSN